MNGVDKEHSECLTDVKLFPLAYDSQIKTTL